MSGRVFNLGVPIPEYANTDEQAQDLLHLCLKKIRDYPSDFIGYDTETTGKKMPFKVGTKYPLDWMTDTVTFWSLSFYDPVPDASAPNDDLDFQLVWLKMLESGQHALPGGHLCHFCLLSVDPKAPQVVRSHVMK